MAYCDNCLRELREIESSLSCPCRPQFDALEAKNAALTEMLVEARKLLVEMRDRTIAAVDESDGRAEYLRKVAVDAMWLGVVHEVGADIRYQLGIDPEATS